MSELAKIETASTPVATASESAALISMIERAARDPNVDIDKMERLFQMQAAAFARRAKAAYIAALAEMQPELPVINRAGKIERTSKGSSGAQERAKPTKYAKWEDIVEGVTPVLAKHGFSISFRIKQEQRIEVTAVLGHKGGHCEETSMSLPIDDSGAKNNIQGWGSSVSYGKRYTACALLNIVSRGEDDDGNAAASEVITDQQADELRDLIAKTRTNIDEFLKLGEVESLSDIPARQFARAKALLVAKLSKAGRK